MTAYATVEELRAEIVGLPDDAQDSDLARQLERASELVDRYVRAPFVVGDDGLPTDETVADALRRAVIAQVEQWCEVGEVNAIDGLAGTQVSTGGFSGLRAPELAPRARHILITAGLMGGAIR